MILRSARVGNIIALASHLYATDSVPYLLKTHRGTGTARAPRLFLFSQAVLYRAEFPTVGNRVAFFPALLAYLQERGYQSGTGEKRMPEARFTHNGKRYFAIAFPNISAAMRYATDISKAVSRRKTSPTYGSKENRRMHVSFSRDLWTTSHF